MSAPVMHLSSLGWAAVVPPGRYFLGDPCYAVPADDWSPLLDSCGIFDRPIGRVRGFEVLAFGTCWGDGEYTDQHSHKYSVDAGLIGLTPIALAQQHRAFARLETLGRIVDFESAARCTSDAMGLLIFGGYMINTDSTEGDTE